MRDDEAPKDIDFIDYYGFKKGSPFHLPSMGGRVEEKDLPDVTVTILRNRGAICFSGPVRKPKYNLRAR